MKNIAESVPFISNFFAFLNKIKVYNVLTIWTCIPKALTQLLPHD